MTKRILLKALESFNDEDELVLGEKAWPYVPEISVICGKGQWLMPYYCTRKKGHEGQCYCSSKNVNFTPEDNNNDQK
jgi:hypothetical protein